MSNEAREVKRYSVTTDHLSDKSAPDYEEWGGIDVVLASDYDAVRALANRRELERDEAIDSAVKYSASYDKLAASHAELREALGGKYGLHTQDCQHLDLSVPYSKCTCGLEDILTRAKAVGESV